MLRPRSGSSTNSSFYSIHCVGSLARILTVTCASLVAVAELSACSSSDDGAALFRGGGAGQDGSSSLGGSSNLGTGGGGGTDPTPILSSDGSTKDGKVDFQACASESAKAELAPVDIYVMLDRSGSMNFDDKWNAVAGAFASFVGNAKFDGLGMGIQYFPLKRMCVTDVYGQPDVEIAPLPGVGPAIASSLAQHEPSGGTPMVPALSGAIAHAKSWAAQNTSHSVVVVLATDGVPDATCLSTLNGAIANTLEGVAAVAAAGVSSSPKVPTFVIGVGSALTELNLIANSGGTGEALLVDTTHDTQSLFLDALNQIRRRTLSCEYLIPTKQADIDPMKVNAQYSFADGRAAEALVYVGSKDACSQAAEGWYYDDPAHPSKVILCEKSCNRVNTDDKVQLDVVFGCQIRLPS